MCVCVICHAAAQQENSVVWEECKAKDVQITSLESQLNGIQQNSCHLASQLEVGAYTLGGGFRVGSHFLKPNTHRAATLELR